MADNDSLSPEEATLVADLAAPKFKLSVAAGHWQLYRREGLLLLFKLSALDRQWYGIRCDCQGYPNLPPYCAAWSIEKNSRATAVERPAGKGELERIFRMDWENGDHLYHPMSRKAIETHENWKKVMPQRQWQPGEGIIQLLIDLHDRLNSSDYQPTDRAAA